MTVVYLDSANVFEIRRFANDPNIEGFTTNPSLLRKHADPGLTYVAWATSILELVAPKPVSLEVVCDDLKEMREQALRINGWGPNVVVKIPVMLTDGTSTAPLVWELQQEEGVRVNVTAVFTTEQVSEMVAVTRSARPHIISIFAGRIADTGTDPRPIIARAKELAGESTDILWASCREVFNITQASLSGADIITVPPELIDKARAVHGTPLIEYSRETARQFLRDGEGIVL
jgi:transaldolase